MDTREDLEALSTVTAFIPGEEWVIFNCGHGRVALSGRAKYTHVTFEDGQLCLWKYGICRVSGIDPMLAASAIIQRSAE